MSNMDLKELIKNLSLTQSGVSKFSFYSTYLNPITDNLSWLTERVLSVPTEESFPHLSAIFDIYESLINIRTIDVREIISKTNTPYLDVFYSAFNARSYEMDSFLNEIITQIKLISDKAVDVNLNFKTYRRSYDCYQLVNRKLYPNFDDPVLSSLVDSFSILEKNEVLTRFEKYIDSGWFSVDINFKDFIYGRISLSELKEKLFDSMGDKFIFAGINQIEVSNFTDYKFFINEKKSLRKRLYKLTPPKALDYCIKSRDGTILLGDVFTTNLNHKSKKRWFNALRSLGLDKNYPNGFKYSVTVNTSSYKKIEANEDKDVIVANDFLSLLTAFDTDDIDYNYSCAELLANIELITLGSDTDIFINNEILSKGPVLINNFALSSANLILDKINKEQDILENHVVLQYLSDALGGLESMVSYDQSLVNNLLDISQKLNTVSSTMEQSFLSKRIGTIADRFSVPQIIHNRYLNNKSNYGLAKISLNNKNIFNKNSYLNNLPTLSNKFNSFKNVLSAFNTSFEKPLQFSNNLQKSKYLPQLSSLSYAAEKLEQGKKITTKIKSISNKYASIHGEEYFMDRFLHNSLECLNYYSNGDYYNFEQTLAKINNHYIKPLIKDPKKFYSLLFSDYRNIKNKGIDNFGKSLDSINPNIALNNYLNNFVSQLNDLSNKLEANEYYLSNKTNI